MAKIPYYIRLTNFRSIYIVLFDTKTPRNLKTLFNFYGSIVYSTYNQSDIQPYLNENYRIKQIKYQHQLMNWYNNLYEKFDLSFNYIFE